VLDCEGITLTYRDSWVYSALTFITGYEIACDCYQVVVTQFKWGIRMKLSIWNSFVAHGTNQIRQIQSMKRGQKQTNWDTTTLLQKVSSTVTMKMQVSAGSL